MALDFGLPAEVTPTSISEEMAKFCQELAPGQMPANVPVRPDAASAPGSYVQNVVSYLSRHGGQCQLGWSLRERPGVYLRARFHACWVSPAEEFVDVTPGEAGETSVLFLPDRKLAWRGTVIVSQFKPLSYKRELTELAALYRKEEQLRLELPINQAEYQNALRQLTAAAQKLAKRLPSG
jgi:hypothetical protein